ncbi:DUF6414 family protein [Corynebacterium halotolerans]|uniref:DUF6414 family protein n=1 Tax=Corynebacterium halotolerans TaxID=225326 RepID=UPI000AE4A5F7|nr:hypothetical protein [Corynebacterium halotolerans]
MSFFRNPIYLDRDTLVPLSNFHGIDVSTDIELTVRDQSSKNGSMEGKAQIPWVSGRGERGTGEETEVTESRRIESHPVSAFNKLVDELEKKDEVLNHFDFGTGISKRQLVEVEREWELSPSNEVGGLLSRLIELFIADPSLLNEERPNNEVIASMLSPQTAKKGQIVLQAVLEDEDAPQVLALLNAGHMVAGNDIDNLENELAIFGQVERVVGENRSFSLEKFYLSGLNRTMRRAISSDQLLAGVAKMTGRNVDRSDLEMTGPLIVVKAMAAY